MPILYLGIECVVSRGGFLPQLARRRWKVAPAPDSEVLAHWVQLSSAAAGCLSAAINTIIPFDDIVNMSVIDLTM